MQQQPIFIVGTGRCGSTLLSNIFQSTNVILSLSEFFCSLSPNAFTYKVLDGEQFWRLLSEPCPRVSQMLRYDIGVPEFLYKSVTPVPPILLMTLPHITDEPEQLYLELKEYVIELPNNQIEQLYLQLFEWLRIRLNKQIWVERSGGSLTYMHQMLELFPNGKFIHLYRDGHECAMSMSRHNGYKLNIIETMIRGQTKYDPYHSKIPEDVRDTMGEMRYLLPDDFHPEKYHNFKIPLETYGALWSSLIVKGSRSFSKLPKENLLHICYEDIINNPQEEIHKLLSFIIPDFNDQQLLDNVAKMVQLEKPLTWTKLPETEKNQLMGACAIGMRYLRKVL